MGFDKKKVKELITIDNIFELLEEYGGEPEYSGDDNLVARTICHNHPHDDASRKLYYYHNNGSGLFHCYTGCAEPSFDIFELMIKIANIQFHQAWDLDQAIRFLVYRFGISVPEEVEEEISSVLKEDYENFEKYERVKNIDLKNYTAELEEYDDKILNNFSYDVILSPWINEGITQDIINEFRIGYYPGTNVITIPHYSEDGRFIGVRGRSLNKEDAEKYGKYRPLRVNDTLYNHPLGYNLYGLDKNKQAIKTMKIAIVAEGEKSVLKYGSFFGQDNNICVACCGSNFTIYQYYLLKSLGVEEIVIAFDKQYKEFGDAEHSHLVRNFYKILNRYINDTRISFIFDDKDVLGYKDAPLDKDKETFLKLFSERRIFEGGIFK